MKQYQQLGERTISLKDFKEYLSIEDDEYPIWYNFSRDLLKAAQKAIKENTDISFEYEPIKKGRQVVGVKFTISANGAYKNRLKLGGWLPEGSVEEFQGEEFIVTTVD